MKKMGRPRLHWSEAKTSNIKALVTKDMLEKVKRMAKEQGISQNEFIRRLIDNA